MFQNNCYVLKHGTFPKTPKKNTGLSDTSVLDAMSFVQGTSPTATPQGALTAMAAKAAELEEAKAPNMATTWGKYTGHGHQMGQ